MTLTRSDYRVQIKEEASFGDLNTDFASGATFLPLMNAGIGLHPTKRLEDIESNLGHPHPRRIATGRDNTGNLITELNRDTREIILDLAFGGLSGGLPSRSKTFGLLKRKAAVAGEFYAGVVANGLGLAGQAGGVVIPTFDLVASHEEPITSPTIALPATLRTPYRFAMAVTILNGAVADSLSGFNLNIANNLLVGPHRSGSLEVSYLEYGNQDVTGDLTVLYEAETYNDLVRGTATGSVWLILGETYATYTGSAWNTDDYFEASADCITWDASATTLATDVAASVGPLALTTMTTPAAGDVVVQRPVLIKLNGIEVPDAPENPGNGGVVQQTVNFQITAPENTTNSPLQVLVDAVS